MKISRRSFMKKSAATTMAVAMPGGIAPVVLANQASSTLSPGPGNKWPGRVVINFNKNAIKENLMSSLDPEVVQVHA